MKKHIFILKVLVIGAAVLLCCVTDISAVSHILSSEKTSLCMIQKGPTRQSTLYANGETIQVSTQSVVSQIPGPSSSDISIQQFQSIIDTSKTSVQKKCRSLLVDSGQRDGFNIQFNVKNATQEMIPAISAVEQYLETLFTDPVTVTINLSFEDLGAGSILGATHMYYVGPITWDYVYAGLINGMDTDDFIQSYLPNSDGAIPIHYNYQNDLVTWESDCYVPVSVYKSTIGTMSGIDADIRINTVIMFPWDYDPTDGVSSENTCFETTLIHEVGHALGFTSGAEFRYHDIEIMDAFRFRYTDGASDYNPDTFEEFQTTPRLVWRENVDNTNDDVVSDIIGEEYRMSDGAPFQTCHLSLVHTIGCMQPTPTGSFYPDFFKESDLTMFDAIGWDYCQEIPTTTLPFFDDFPVYTLDEMKWSSSQNCYIWSDGSNEPSPPYSLELLTYYYGDGGQVRTNRIDTSSLSKLSIQFYYERRGSHNQPEPGEDLVLLYLNNNHQWMEVGRILADGPNMVNYELVSYFITVADAFHPDFRVQIKSLGQLGTNEMPPWADNWFVDDFSITDFRPVVETLAAQDITSTSALLKGQIMNDGDESCQVRFKYAVSECPDLSPFIRMDMAGEITWTYVSDWYGSFHTNDVFQETVNGLTAGTLYVYRAGALNSQGEDWGTYTQFITGNNKK